MAVANNPPLGLNATPLGKLPVATGDPAAVRVPAEPTANIDTVLLDALLTASSPLEALNATEVGSLPPVANGEPEMGVNAPLAPTANIDTVLSPLLVAARNLPSGLNATEMGPCPLANGEPWICENSGAPAAPDVTANK